MIDSAFPVMIIVETEFKLNEKSKRDPNCAIKIIIAFDAIQAVIIFFSFEPSNRIKTIENPSSSVEYINVQFAMPLSVFIWRRLDDLAQGAGKGAHGIALISQGKPEVQPARHRAEQLGLAAQLARNLTNHKQAERRRVGTVGVAARASVEDTICQKFCAC